MPIEESGEYDNFLNQKTEVEKPNTLFEVEEDDDSEKEKLWRGMPEFTQEDKKAFKTVYLHFRTEEDYKEFVKKYKAVDTDQFFSDKTKSFWYPHLEKDKNYLKRWLEE